MLNHFGCKNGVRNKWDQGITWDFVEPVVLVAMERFRTVTMEVPEPSVTVEEPDSESDDFEPKLLLVEPTVASVGACGTLYSGSPLSGVWIWALCKILWLAWKLEKVVVGAWRGLTQTDPGPTVAYTVFLKGIE